MSSFGLPEREPGLAFRTHEERSRRQKNPVKGKPLSPDDPKLRALEAYIIAQRNGVPIAYGKH